MPTSADPRRAEFLTLLYDEDILQTFRATDPDLLVDIARGLIVELVEGRYESAKFAARLYGIPGDALDLLAAVGLTVYAPHTAAALLTRANEGSVIAIRRALRAAGFDLVREPRPRL